MIQSHTTPLIPHTTLMSLPHRSSSHIHHLFCTHTTHLTSSPLTPTPQHSSHIHTNHVMPTLFTLTPTPLNTTSHTINSNPYIHSFNSTFFFYIKLALFDLTHMHSNPLYSTHIHSSQFHTSTSSMHTFLTHPYFLFLFFSPQ